MDQNKTVNQREAARGVKHVKDLMKARDNWLSKYNKAVTDAQIKKNKAANSKAGKLARKRVLEDKERERLARVQSAIRIPLNPKKDGSSSSKFAPSGSDNNNVGEDVANNTGVEMNLHRLLGSQLQGEPRGESLSKGQASICGMSSIRHGNNTVLDVTDLDETTGGKVMFTNKAAFRADTINKLDQVIATTSNIASSMHGRDKEMADHVKKSNSAISVSSL